MKKILALLLCMAALSLTACSPAPTATPTPTPSTTLTPHPLWGPTPSPTKGAFLPAGELVLGEVMAIDAPYEVQLKKAEMPTGLGEEPAYLDIYSCTDPAYPAETSYLFAVLYAEEDDFASREQLEKSYSDFVTLFMEGVETAEATALTLSSPEGDIEGLRIVTSQNSVPLDIRVMPWKDRLIMAFGVAVNKDLEAVLPTLDTLRFK